MPNGVNIGRQIPEWFKKEGESLRQDLGISYVPRWSIVPHGRPQSVAEHSWRVARLAMTIADLLGYDEARRNAAAARAIMHDVEEAVTGDVPSPVKDARGEEGGYFDEIGWVVDLADKVEALGYITTWGAGWKRDMVIRYMVAKVAAVVERGKEYFDDEELEGVLTVLYNYAEGA